jgi:hypothetical protein
VVEREGGGGSVLTFLLRWWCYFDGRVIGFAVY